MKKFFLTCLAALMLLTAAGCGGDPGEQSSDPGESTMTDQQFTLSQLSGTDALGRKVSAVSDRLEGKYVGIYYFMWHGYHTQRIYDTSEILAEYENGIVGNPENPLWEVDPSSPVYDASVSPNSAFHYWSEPLYGYYNSEDPWVARKHLELLSYADVDYLLLDYTNGYIYETATLTLIRTILDMRAEGWEVPQLAFMLPVDSAASQTTFNAVYESYLSHPEYEGAFFTADENLNPSGKPLVTGTLTEEALGQEKWNAIWYKPLQWPDRPYDDDALPWIDWNNRNIQHNHNGVMSVSIAQHVAGTWSSDPYLYPGEQFFRGRGWVQTSPTDNGADQENVMSGTNFQFQWDNVFASEEEVEMVVVTGWNEWIAQKQSTLMQPYHTSLRAVFVDSFNMPFSRDAEMMKGGYGDNYYLQLVENIRTFKYGDIQSGAVENQPVTLDIFQGVSAWTQIQNVYLDAAGETVDRDFISVDPSVRYRDGSARNDVVSLKFANDAEYLYIRAETRQPVTAYEPGDTGWMNVWISANGGSGWENFDFLINRSPAGQTTSVEAFNGSSLERVGEAKFFVQANYIFYAVPLSALGLSSSDEIGIKITDNIEVFSEDFSTDSFYTTGESAPCGRLNYAYKLA